MMERRARLEDDERILVMVGCLVGACGCARSFVVPVCDGSHDVAQTRSNEESIRSRRVLVHSQRWPNRQTEPKKGCPNATKPAASPQQLMAQATFNIWLDLAPLHEFNLVLRERRKDLNCVTVLFLHVSWHYAQSLNPLVCVRSCSCLFVYILLFSVSFIGCSPCVWLGLCRYRPSAFVCTPFTLNPVRQ